HPDRGHAPRRARTPRVRRGRTRPAGGRRGARGDRLRWARLRRARPPQAPRARGGGPLARSPARRHSRRLHPPSLTRPGAALPGLPVDVLETRLSPTGADRLRAMTEEIAADPAAIERLFPAAAREVGRGPLDADDPTGIVGPTLDDVVRAALLDALARVRSV